MPIWYIAVATRSADGPCRLIWVCSITLSRIAFLACPFLLQSKRLSSGLNQIPAKFRDFLTIFLMVGDMSGRWMCASNLGLTDRASAYELVMDMVRVLPVSDPEHAAMRRLTPCGRGDPVADPYGNGLRAGGGRDQSFEAITAIYEAKGRPRFNPLICHVADLEMARAHVVFSPVAERLAAAFWPGPLTLVLPLNRGGRESTRLPLPAWKRQRCAMPRRAGTRTLIGSGSAVRWPRQAPTGRARISPTSAQHVSRTTLATGSSSLLTAAPARVGVESTILADGRRPADDCSDRAAFRWNCPRSGGAVLTGRTRPARHARGRSGDRTGHAERRTTRPDTLIAAQRDQRAAGRSDPPVWRSGARWGGKGQPW
jgi:tRNA A37 threonylcarbamoyladenosine synthetase subunit TsaC/SUA5/YrdC